MAEYGFTVIFEQLEEGGYQVIVPALPGIVTYGRTLPEARELASDAIACHIRGLLKDNAAEEKLMRLRQLKGLKVATSSWKDKDHPELRQGAAKWVSKLRRQDEKRFHKITAR
jgi:predicted RNase H-like HicB family nuclease